MDPNNAQLVRDIREAIYDTYTLAANTAMPLRIVLFQTPQSATVGPETTNMLQAGQLPNPEHVDVYAVEVDFVGMLALDVIGVCQHYVLRLNISGKPMLTFPLNPRFENIISTKASDVIMSAIARVEMPDDAKIEILHGAPFYAELVSSSGFTSTNINGLGIWMRVKLDGIHTVMVN